MNNFYSGVGSRETPLEVMHLMSGVAYRLESCGYILRSGGADGADIAFEIGVKGDAKEIWVPWLGFNDSTSTNLPSPEAFEIASQIHPAWDKLKQGAKALHARNIHQLLGKDLQTPSEFVLCYTRNGDTIGGTATVIRLATQLKIPIFNFGKYTDKYAAVEALDLFLFKVNPEKF